MKTCWILPPARNGLPWPLRRALGPVSPPIRSQASMSRFTRSSRHRATPGGPPPREPTLFLRITRKVLASAWRLTSRGASTTAQHSSHYLDGGLAVSQTLFAPRPKAARRLRLTENFFPSEVFLRGKVAL